MKKIVIGLIFLYSSINIAMEAPSPDNSLSIEYVEQLAALPTELQATILVGHNQFNKIPRLINHDKIYFMVARALFSTFVEPKVILSENFTQLTSQAGDFGGLDEETRGKLFPFFTNCMEKFPRNPHPYCWYDGPNLEGTYLSTSQFDGGVSLGSKVASEKIFGFSLDNPVGAICKYINNYAFLGEVLSCDELYPLGYPKKQIYFKIHNPDGIVSKHEHTSTSLNLKKMAFITLRCLLGLTHEGELYTFNFDGDKEKSQKKMVSYKQTVKNQAQKELIVNNFAVNNVYPWFALVHVINPDTEQSALGIINWINKTKTKAKIKTLPILLKVEDVKKLIFCDEWFGWLDSENQLHVHSLQLLPQQKSDAEAIIPTQNVTKKNWMGKLISWYKKNN